MKKVKLLTLIVVCLMIVGLIPAVHAQTAKEVKITAWTADQLYIDYFKTRTAEFEKLHPEIKFTWDWVSKPNAPADALQALAAGEPIPDLLGMERKQFANYMRVGHKVS